MLPQAIPPMGVLSLAAYLRTKFDLDIMVVNQRQEACSTEDIARRAVDFKADIVGLSALTMGGYSLGPLTATVRSGLPDSLILLGGPYVAGAGILALKETSADAAVIGEGERSLEAIVLARCCGNGNLADIPALIWRNHDGTVVQNPGTTPVVENLDDLPYPAYDLIDLPAYWRAVSFSPVTHRNYVTLMTSRGCPYQCIYCQHILGRRFRGFSAERMADEIGYYVKQYGIKAVEFLDDVFNFDRQRVLDFCELVIKRNFKLKFSFPNGLRADIMTEEVVDALAAAGTDQCTYALESGSPRIQKLIGKHLNIPRFQQTIEWTAKRGVFTHVFNMLGFPTETEEEMQETIDVCCAVPAHTASFFTVIPLPGTPIYKMAKERTPEKLAEVDYRDLELSNTRVNLSAVPDHVLYAYQRKGQQKFYVNPTRLWRILRDHPNRRSLPRAGLQFLRRATKSIFR